MTAHYLTFYNLLKLVFGLFPFQDYHIIVEQKLMCFHKHLFYLFLLFPLLCVEGYGK